MPHIEKTEAIVLRVIPFSETSQVVIWLTPERGRVATMIKGARRAKSPFLGQYDLFYTCELVYYVREQSSMHIARECYPLELRPSFRTDWRAAAIASYAADLVSRGSLEGGHQHDTFALLVSLLDSLSERTPDMPRPRTSLLFWFELRLLKTLGLAPRLDSCATCGQTIPPGQPAHYSFRQNGAICARCPAIDPQSQLLLRPDALALLRLWGRSSSPNTAKNTVCSSEQTFALRPLFDTLLDQMAGISTENRRLAEEAIQA